MSQNQITKQTLHFLHANMRSLTKNFDLLQELLNEMPHLPDLIAISETKLNENSSLNLINLPGYCFINQNSMSAFGGVGLYIKHNIPFVERRNINFFTNKYESIWVELNKQDKTTKNLIIGVVYRHPHSSNTEFTDELLKLMYDLSKENKVIGIVRPRLYKIVE